MKCHLLFAQITRQTYECNCVYEQQIYREKHHIEQMTILIHIMNTYQINYKCHFGMHLQDFQDAKKNDFALASNNSLCLQ